MYFLAYWCNTLRFGTGNEFPNREHNLHKSAKTNIAEGVGIHLDICIGAFDLVAKAI